MTTILPTSALARLAGLSTGVGSGVVQQAPPEIARIASGAIVDGTVIGRDREGLTLIKTDHGVFRLKTSAKLPDGAAIKLELQIHGNQIRAVILTIEPAAVGNRGTAGTVHDVAHKSSMASVSQGHVQTTPTLARQDIFPVGKGPLLSTGSLVAVRLLPVSDTRFAPGREATGPPFQTASGQGIPSTNAPSATAAHRPGGALIVQITGIEPPARERLGGSRTAVSPLPPAGHGPSPVSQATLPVSQAPSMSSAETHGGGPASSAAPGERGPVGPGPLPSVLSAQVVASETRPAASHSPSMTSGAGPPEPPAATVSPPTTHLAARGSATEAARGTGPGLSAEHYTGTVVGQNGSGGVILATPIGRLLMLTGSTLQPNTTIRFKVTNGAEQLIPGAVNRGAGPTGVGLAQDWPMLRQLIASMGTADGQSALRLAETHLPQPGPRLAHGILFFIAAVGLGDIGRWLGAGLQAELRSRGQTELFGRLSDDFQQLSRMVTDGAHGDWRTYLVPLWDGETMRQLRFFHRHRDGDHDGDGGQRGDRFLIDLALSRLGAFQIDGLLQTPRFSLIVRSQKPLDQTARNGIAEIFREGCGNAGLTGEISYSGAGDFVPLPFAGRNRDTGAMTA